MDSTQQTQPTSPSPPPHPHTHHNKKLVHGQHTADATYIPHPPHTHHSKSNDVIYRKELKKQKQTWSKLGSRLSKASTYLYSLIISCCTKNSFPGWKSCSNGHEHYPPLPHFIYFHNRKKRCLPNIRTGQTEEILSVLVKKNNKKLTIETQG